MPPRLDVPSRVVGPAGPLARRRQDGATATTRAGTESPRGTRPFLGEVAQEVGAGEQLGRGRASFDEAVHHDVRVPLAPAREQLRQQQLLAVAHLVLGQAHPQPRGVDTDDVPGVHDVQRGFPGLGRLERVRQQEFRLPRTVQAHDHGAVDQPLPAVAPAPHHRRRAVAVRGDGQRDRTGQQAGETSQTSITDHHELGAARFVDHHRWRGAGARLGFHRHAGAFRTRGVGGRGQPLLHLDAHRRVVLARPRQPGDLREHGQREHVGVDDPQGGAPPSGRSGRPPHGTARGPRTVDAHDDRISGVSAHVVPLFRLDTPQRRDERSRRLRRTARPGHVRPRAIPAPPASQQEIGRAPRIGTTSALTREDGRPAADRARSGRAPGWSTPAASR